MCSKDKLEASLSTCTLKLAWVSSTNQLKHSGPLCYRLTLNFSQIPIFNYKALLMNIKCQLKPIQTN